MKTIPDEVLKIIREHRPHLGSIIDNLLAASSQASSPELVRALERDLARAYLYGETRLTPLDTWRLAACSAGEPFGTKVGKPRNAGVGLTDEDQESLEENLARRHGYDSFGEMMGAAEEYDAQRRDL
jgi:hypothetical protein